MTVRQLVRSFDALLSQYYGIHEFTDDPECIIRVARARAGRDIVLSDGTSLRAEDPVLDLHWWNERLPRIPERGPDPAWAAAMRRRILSSLRGLGRHLAGVHDYDDVRGLRAEIVFGTRMGRQQLVRAARRFGFDVVERQSPHGLTAQLHHAGDSILLWGLIWAYNPGGLKHKPLLRERDELWISRTALVHRSA
jgi:hypothetical protein